MEVNSAQDVATLNYFNPQKCTPSKPTAFIYTSALALWVLMCPLEKILME